MTPRQSKTASDLYQTASRYLVGGVAAAARSASIFGVPFFIDHAEGSLIVDVQGKEYLDLHTSFGAALLGHKHPAVMKAVGQAMDMGMPCAFENEYNGIVARKLVEMLPCAEKVRFSGTGTEATYHAVKLARGYTGREMVVKFEGHFHGFNDVLQYNYWPGRDEGLPKLHPESLGVPKAMDELVTVLSFNDVDALEKTIRRHKARIAAVVLEPVNFNSGGILPTGEFLEVLRSLTAEHGIVLIFDEILSGFRTGPGCMQAHLGVTPDLCTVGKALGGGMHLSALAGRADIMDHLTPLGKVSHSGTYLGHPAAILACNTFLDEISKPGFWDALLGRCDQLYSGLRDIIERRGVKCRLQSVGARFCLLFGLEDEPTCYADMVRNRDVERTNRFFRAAMANGVFTWHGYHHGISAAHSQADVETILERLDTSIAGIV